MRHSFPSAVRRFCGNQRLLRFGGLVILVMLLIGYQVQPKSPLIRKARAANLPSGFVETLILSAVTNPTGMDFAPDGRLFITQQNGIVRVYNNGSLLPTPFINVNADTTMDLGLMGLTFDPNFSSNQYVYLYYTATTPTVHNRLVRVTANGDVADITTLTSLLEFDTLSSGSTMNIGGTLFFGPDGKLYLGVGDVENASNAQMTSTLYGKILRMNPDGSIPTDNPFYGMYSGNNRLIFAMGLRNPYTFSIQPGTGRLLVNDVGKDGWEEIDDIVSGANYGWPIHEGFAIDPKYQNPLYAYPHVGSGVTGCAITGGTFYNPTVNQFPGQYIGQYFFSDYCSGWIKVYDVANNIVSDFATGINYPINLKLGGDGSLYYLARGFGGSTGEIYKIQYIASQPPSVAQQPANTLVSDGYTATLNVSVSGTTPINYQWQRNDVDIPGATASTYTTPPMSLSDSGTQFRCIATNGFGTVTSNEATVTVTSDSPPVGTIYNPPDGTMYNAGDTIIYSGTATDAEDGNLPASAYTWWIDFHHNAHTHPFMTATSGITGGSFTIPNVGEVSANTWYRIYLQVTDSVGLTHTSYHEIFPRKSTITLQTYPAGLSLSLDDTPQNAPISSPSVVNMTRKLSALTQQRANGRIWVFDHWSDGGAAAHTILTPASDTTYTAVYAALGPFVEQSGQVTLEAEDYDDNISRGSQAWIFRNGLYGFSGTGYMRADPDENVSYLTTGYSANSPELRYLVQFNSTGTHYIWARLSVPSVYSDTIHVGLDNTETPSGERIQLATSTFDTWLWTRTTIDGTIASVNIPSTGMHTINIWMGKDGVRVDKLILTTDPNFVPSGNGPAESQRDIPLNATPTGVSPTNTPTPTSTPVPATTFKVQYRPGDTLVVNGQIRPQFKIFKSDSSTVSLSELKLRYYFTRDTAQPMTFNCVYTVFDCSNLTAQFVPINPPLPGADYYLELGFTSAAGIVGNSGTLIQTRFNKNNWSNFSQSDDYSYNNTLTAFTDWPQVTLYRNGTLVWGTEPSSTPAPTSTPTNTPMPPTPTVTPTPVVPTNTPMPATNTPVPTFIPLTSTPGPNTNTPVPPTSTPTATPTSGPLTLRVKYYAGITPSTTSEIQPNILIENNTASSIPLSSLKIRYWFTKDSPRTIMYVCYWATAGCTNVYGSFTDLSTARPGADNYVEVGFNGGAGNLLPNYTTEVQYEAHKNDWSNFNQSDDYSFDGTKTAYAVWSHITLYQNGVLVWGNEP